MARGKERASVAKAKSKPSRLAKNDVTPETKNEESLQTREMPLDLQQKCLNLFQHALNPDDEADAEILREVKGQLYNRNFEAAFGKPDNLRVYASRWSPSRALGYLDIFVGIASHLIDNCGESDKLTSDAFRVVCLGGGAGAEAIGLAGWVNMETVQPVSTMPSLRADLVDAAEWSGVVENLFQSIVTPPVLSKYASAAVQEANTALLSQESYTVHLHRMDVLEASNDYSMAGLTAAADLATLMFTLNELYSISIAKTQALLAKLTESIRPGAHLLVVDSPGSYSTVSINGAEKKYPMRWLLDHTLIEPTSRNTVPRWCKLISDDSRWFRLPQGLQYPIALENMRYQIHLYRRNTDEPT